MDKLFKSLAVPIRRDILKLLKDSELSASEISNNFNVTNATISHHLTVLKDAGLISSRKFKNNIYYSLKTSIFEDIVTYFLDLKGDLND